MGKRKTVLTPGMAFIVACFVIHSLACLLLFLDERLACATLNFLPAERSLFCSR